MSDSKLGPQRRLRQQRSPTQLPLFPPVHNGAPGFQFLRGHSTPNPNLDKALGPRGFYLRGRASAIFGMGFGCGFGLSGGFFSGFGFSAMTGSPRRGKCEGISSTGSRNATIERSCPRKITYPTVYSGPTSPERGCSAISRISWRSIVACRPVRRRITRRRVTNSTPPRRQFRLPRPYSPRTPESDS